MKLAAESQELHALTSIIWLGTYIIFNTGDFSSGPAGTRTTISFALMALRVPAFILARRTPEHKGLAQQSP